MRPLNFALGVLVGAVFSSAIVIAWSGPSATPPDDNVAAPINVGSTAQTKSGSLLIDNILEADDLTIWGSAILGGSGNYLNFGTVPGSSGYGIRDNAGVMEVKNSNGSWSSMISNASSTGTVGGGCNGDGTGWGNATGCSTSSCSSGGLGTCPSGYIALELPFAQQRSCTGGTPGIGYAPSNCGCGSYQATCTGVMGTQNRCTGYNPSYYPLFTLCIKM